MSESVPRSDGPDDPVETSATDDPSTDSNAEVTEEEVTSVPAKSIRRPYSEEEDTEEEAELGAKMSFLEHLDELRKRIVYSALAIAVTFAASFVFREAIFDYLQAPILDVLKERGLGTELVITKVTDAFTIWLKVCFTSGVFLAAPFLAWQIWLFIAPGLYQREKRFAIPFFLGSTGLFLTGGLFAYYIVLPAGLRFLILEMGGQFNPLLTAVDYFSFEVIILVGMGTVFQMPVIIAFLSIFGLVTPGFLWKNFRYAFLIITILAAVASPTPDALNLFFWIAPMVVLYVISIGISWIFKQRRLKKQAEEAL